MGEDRNPILFRQINLSKFALPHEIGPRPSPGRQLGYAEISSKCCPRYESAGREKKRVARNLRLLHLLRLNFRYVLPMQRDQAPT
jgi:hypothetical protein